MVDVITACKNLKPSQVPLAHRTCAEAAAAAHAVCQRLRGQEPASQLQPMPRLSSTPTQAPAQPGPPMRPAPTISQTNHPCTHHNTATEKLTVERSVEIMSEHWHAQQIGILVACAYFKNKEGAYKEHTVYVMTDGKEQSAAITQAAVNQVVCYLLAEHDMDMRQLYMWSDGCAGQFKGAPAMRQHWGMAQRFSMPVWWSYGATAHFKGRHDSEGGVVKQWLRGEILADRVGKCNALGFVQHCNAYHKPAAAADPSKAHRARASVGHRWCLELSTREAMPMFDQKRDDKHWDDECLTLLCSFAPDSVKQLCTLGKKLSVKMLNEYCKAVGLYVPANTLRADLRYMVLEHLNGQAEWD
ncbi:hypothetical protein QJQ45_008663 [Haematococcus lacustris]|nr:hypothetical protein QJQ45_008663 [Haematococcus lacustris]